MELQNAKPVIISAGIGGWYAKGVERLEKSLNFHGWAGDVMTWKDVQPQDSRAHNDYPYYFKLAAFRGAIAKGYTHILWCDASFWSIQNPMPIFDFVNSNGFYIFRSGYTLAQTVNDAALEILQIDRDELDQQPEYASGCFGINLHNPDGQKLLERWGLYMDMGLSRGSRSHNNESADPRFLHHRQDQTCLSLAMYTLALSVNEPDYVAYYGGGYDPRKCLFFINGL